MSTTIYITRHGQTLWNTEKRMQGWNDSHLTKLGIDQAKCLQKRLESINIDKIYSSPIGRARKTAEIIRDGRNIPIIFDDRLKEINMGKWEGMTKQDIEKNYKEQINNFWNSPSNYIPQCGESFEQLKYRIGNFIKYVLDENVNKNILLVTHTIAIKAIMNYLQCNSIDVFWGTQYIQPTSLTVVEIKDEQIKILKDADTSHLKYLNSEEVI